MHQDSRTNLILFVIVLLLALIAWFKPGLEQSRFKYLSSLNSNDIHNIVIERRGIEAIRLSKKGKHWFLQSPYHLPANPLRVRTILALAHKRSYSSFKVQEKELQRYHLDKPAVSIWLDDQRFDIGSEAPLNGQRYALNMRENIDSADAEGDSKFTVHLINGAVYYQLRARIDSFISPLLLPAGAQIQQLKWPNFTLIVNNGKWQLKTSRDRAGIDADSVSRLIQYWQETQASKVEARVQINQKLEKEELLSQKSIQLKVKQADGEQTITYTIIQENNQIKLLRRDLKIAWWITPQQLKLLTEFIPVTKNLKNSP